MYNSFSYGKEIRLAETYWRLPVGRVSTSVDAHSPKRNLENRITQRLRYNTLISDINDIFATTMLCVNERII